jgi:hypothetical protein
MNEKKLHVILARVNQHPPRTPSNGGMTITRTPLWMNLKLS